MNYFRKKFNQTPFFLKNVLVLFCCSLGYQGYVEAKEYQDTQRITIELKNQSLPATLKQLEKESGYLFFYQDKIIDEAKNLNYKFENQTVTEILRVILADTDNAFAVSGRQITIYKKRQAKTENDAGPEPEPRQAGSFVVTGTVVDENGDALPNASVRLLSSPQLGIVADTDGNFSIAIPNSLAKPWTLVVSFVGMESKQITLEEGIARYYIELNPDKELEEVVVLGYFNRARDSFTGSAVVVSGEDLKRVNPNNVLRSLEAFDPSFKLLADNFSGSNPNSLPNINVRGVSSLPTNASSEVLRRDNIASSANMPTFILDGFEVSVEKIYDLDINRISSITLLKDAAATAIYGSRASNGILIITTVTPKEGKVRVSYNYELNTSFADLGSYDVLNAEDKLEYERLAGVYETPGISLQEQEQLYYQKLYNVISGVNTDWLAQPVQNALGHKHSLYIDGGSESIRYGINGLVQTVPGVMKSSGRGRYSLGMDLTYSQLSKIIFKNSLTVSRVTSEDTPYGSFSDYVSMNPYYPKTDTKGEIVQEIDTWSERTTSGNLSNLIVLNPLYNSTLNSFYKTKYWEINNSFSAEWNILPSLRLRGGFSLLQKNTTGDQFTSPSSNQFFFYSLEDISKKGSYNYSNQEETYLDGSATLTYNFRLQDHFFNLAGGLNVRTGKTSYKSFSAIGFTNDRFTDIGFAREYAEGSSPYSLNYEERLFGTFYSLNYSFKDKYLLDASFRMDGSSKFGTNNKFAPFWAAGIGWNLHQEKFVKENFKYFSQLRLRVNTGLTGSVQFSPFMANTLYEYNKNNWYSTGVGVIVSQYGNKNLKWQRTENKDFVLDIGLLNDKIYLSARYYNRLTKDMLTDITLPPSTGFNSYKDNLGDIENKGYELSLKLNILKRKDLDVSVSGNFVHNRNRLLKISNALKELNDKADDIQNDPNNAASSVPLLRYQEGQSINTIYAVRSLGIDPENGQEIFVKKDGTLTHEWSVDDIVPIRDATPKIEGSFRTNFYYKGFLLDLAFFTRYGGYEYNQTLIDRVENADPRYNLDSRAMSDRWKNPGDHSLYKNIQDKTVTRVTSRFIQHDNLLDLRSVSLSYDWKAHFVKDLGLSMFRTTVTANDLWQASTIKIERGINYPFARSCTFSLQANF